MGLCEHEALRYTWMKAETLNVQIQSAMDATNAWTKSMKSSKNHFFTQNGLPERPGSLPKAPADAHGTALEPPGLARGGPRARFLPKIEPKWGKLHEK